IPAMRRAHTFVASVGQKLSTQSVMLDVVDGLQQAETEHRLSEQPPEDIDAERCCEESEQSDAQKPGIQDVVLRRPTRLAPTRQAPALQVPRGPQTPERRSRDEEPEALAQPGARWVARGGDI